MSFSAALVLHISAGTIALFYSAAAMFFRKGSRRHRETGKVFVISMLILGVSGAYLGFMKHEMMSGMMGVLTVYLSATAWSTARRRDGEAGVFDLGALMVPLAVAAVLAIYGVEAANSQTGAIDGYPAAVYFIFGSVALISAMGDVRMLLRGGVFGAHRITRHLWRMCFAMFFAAGSFFLGPANRPLRLLSAMGLGQQPFPALLSKNALLLLAFLPLILMIFWLFRVRFTNAYKGKSIPRGADAYSLRT
jgi:uncharacterized membrane protein